MNLADFFYGAGAILLGTLVGTLLGCRLTYSFQKKLLQQQLDFQREQAAADAEQRKEISNHVVGAIDDARGHLKFQIGHSFSELVKTAHELLPPKGRP